MFRHFVVRFVESHFASSVRNNACFQIVALQDTRNAAVIPESVHVSGDPALLIHGKERFHVGVPAVRQRRDKHVRRNRFTGIRVDDRRGISRPVHLHDLAGLVVQVHRRVGFNCVVTVMLFELRQLIRQFAFLSALLAVFEPQEIQRDAVFLQFLVNVLIVRHFVFRL